MTSANLDIAFNDEQAMIMDSAREFCRDQSNITAVRSLLTSNLGHDPAVWSEICKLGWMGITIPDHFGGSGFGLGALIAIVENMGRYMLTPPLISTTLAAQALLRGGSDTQKNQWLPAIAKGCCATLALLENEDWGADIKLSAIDAGDKITLQGVKKFVADAQAAEFFIVSARYRDQLMLVLVEANRLPAGAITENILIDQTKRASTVNFSGVSVPVTACLNHIATTFRDIKLIGALLHAAEATGCCATSLDTIVSYLTTRSQFGRLIGSYQALKHPTVDILMQMDSARSLIYHAATLIDGDSFSIDSEIACRMAKVQADEALLFAGDRAVQFHGAMGFTFDCDAQLYLRRAQWCQHQYGDAQHHRKHLAPLLLDATHE